ncbi:hypothetical protein [Variovorax sp. EBFNA2]|uniref:hypothetical protein n=1 Tax=Variovorax sp. EBFNA2 TaxID=3342097 RepID=UPI0029C01DEC|nr:hypothetical protein [Variovorax boronicumulans]WPG36935.1 hypothetical protein RZE79_26180 [Variovorax boronicumulans]
MTKSNVFSLFDRRQRSVEFDAKTREAEKAVQLSLPFCAPRDLIFVLTSSFRASDVFCRFATAIMASTIIDLRIAPRLDFVRPTRAQAFSFFEASNIDYKDMFGRSGINSYFEEDSAYKTLWRSIVSEIEASSSSAGPAIVLVDDAAFLLRSSEALGSAFSALKMDEAMILQRTDDTELLRM